MDSMSWFEERKAAICKPLTWDYTSSDESDISEDKNGHPYLKGYTVKKLSWERTTLRNTKKAQKLKRKQRSALCLVLV